MGTLPLSASLLRLAMARIRLLCERGSFAFQMRNVRGQPADSISRNPASGMNKLAGFVALGIIAVIVGIGLKLGEVAANYILSL